MSRTLSISLWLICALTAYGADDLVQPQGILRKAMANARAAAADGRSFSYTKETVREDTDPSGHVTSHKTQVRAAQSRPIGPADACRWSNNHGINLDEELLTRYQFKLVGRTLLRGRTALEITFSPKDGSVAGHHPMDKLLNDATGTIWVDEEDMELAAAKVRLIQPVSLVVIGAIDALSFGFERTRSTDGLWLTTRTETNFRGRRLLSPVQFSQVTQFTDYKVEELTTVRRSSRKKDRSS